MQKIEQVLHDKLPGFPTPEWNSQAFALLPECVTEKHTASLIEPGRNLLNLGGKRWRPLLLVLCAQAAARTEDAPEAAYKLVPLVEFVHTATLIHDDIEDAADTRRGAPAAHITHGLDTALNAGSWLYFAAPACIDSSALPAEQRLSLYRLYAQELRRLHLGQAMDIAWHKDNTSIPGVAEYTAMVRLKTGTLASLAARAGTIAGGGSEAQAAQIGTAAADIGIGFQVLDDVINLSTGNPGKKRGDDIVEGKKSLPIIMHLTSHPEDFERIMDCLNRARKDGITSPAVEECLQIVESSGAVAEAEKLANLLITEACERTFRLYPDSPVPHKIEALFAGMLRRKA